MKEKILYPRLLLSLLAAVMLTLSLATSVFAEATTSVKEPFDDTTRSTDCVGEHVHFTGWMHYAYKLISITDEGESYAILHYNTQGMKGTGITTGTEYVGSQSTTFKDYYYNYATGVASFTSEIFNVNIISKGSAPNLTLRVQFRIMVDASGVTTVKIDRTDLQCRG
ncbi:MAG TPA: hypothetical protein VH186_03370 [Chloroflexia bacterium]|nr:hypothetical protein [Chloroflexia bacterium]